MDALLKGQTASHHLIDIEAGARKRPRVLLRGLWWRAARLLVEQVEGVVAVVDEVDALAVGTYSQTEKRTGTRAAGIDGLRCKLHSCGRGFYQVAVSSVHGEDVVIGCDGETQRLVQAAACRNGRAGSGAGESEQSIWNGGNAIRKRVSNVECAVLAEAETSRANKQSCRVGALGKLRAYDIAEQFAGLLVLIKQKHDAHDGSAIYHVSVCGDRSVQNVGNEQLGELSTIEGGHIPGTVDSYALVRSGQGLDDTAVTIQHEKAAGFRGCRSAVGCGQTSHDHPA